MRRPGCAYNQLVASNVAAASRRQGRASRRPDAQGVWRHRRRRQDRTVQLDVAAWVTRESVVSGMGRRSVPKQYALSDTCGVLRQPEAPDEARGRASRVLPAVAAALAAAVLLLGFAPPAEAAPIV